MKQLEINFEKIISGIQPAIELDFTIDLLLLNCSALLLLCVTYKIIRETNLLHTILYLSLLSLLLTISYLLMDAPDVAMTEAAINSCLSTCILLIIIDKIGLQNRTDNKKNVLVAIILSISLASILLYAGNDLFLFGTPESPLQEHISHYYVTKTASDIGINSTVAAILASYRGFDTMGETLVIFTAGLAVIIIFSLGRGKNTSVK